MISWAERVFEAFANLGLKHEAPWVLEHLRTQQNANIETMTTEIITRRQAGEPLAYILGNWPFVGLELKVGPGVLIPRPETEELADKIAQLFLSNIKSGASVKILDLGAGSGALGIGVAHLLLQQSQISIARVELYSVERSAAALDILNHNLNALLAKWGPERLVIHCLSTSWNEIAKDVSHIDVMLGNPPYVTHGEWRDDVEDTVKNFEPTSAFTPEPLSVGQVALAHRLGLSPEVAEATAMGPLLENIAVASARLGPGGLVGIEIGPAQASVMESGTLERLAREFNLRLGLVRDLSNKLRFLVGNQDG